MNDADSLVSIPFGLFHFLNNNNLGLCLPITNMKSTDINFDLKYVCTGTNTCLVQYSICENTLLICIILEM